MRPHLEYANSVWSPLNKTDATLIENVQRRATKLVPNLKELDYEDRLKKLKLPSLSYRRLRGDLIETYKITHGLYNIDPESFFEFNCDARTRGHNYKIKKQSARLEIRKHYYGMRVVDLWNSLPNSVVKAKTINSFKNQLDRLLVNHLYCVTIDNAQVIKDLKRSSVSCSNQDTKDAPED